MSPVKTSFSCAWTNPAGGLPKSWMAAPDVLHPPHCGFVHRSSEYAGWLFQVPIVQTTRSPRSRFESIGMKRSSSSGRMEVHQIASRRTMGNRCRAWLPPPKWAALLEDVEVFARRSSHSRQFFRVLSKVQIYAPEDSAAAPENLRIMHAKMIRALLAIGGFGQRYGARLIKAVLPEGGDHFLQAHFRAAQTGFHRSRRPLFLR